LVRCHPPTNAANRAWVLRIVAKAPPRTLTLDSASVLIRDRMKHSVAFLKL
jgi:hypothetical protein